jgi:flagellar hook-associated protein 3 FlgL
MRVAFNTYTDNLTSQLGDLATRQSQLQLQASSGQRIQYASDDPSAMQQILTAQNQAKQITQYQKNIGKQLDLAQSTYTAVNSLKTISNRASEIVTLANDLTSPDRMTIYSGEVNELIKQAVTIANSKYNNTFLFAGTTANQPPYSMTLDDSGNVTDVSFQGNESVNSVEIAPDTTLTAQITGSNTTGSGERGLFTDSASGADLFAHLISLRDHLVTKDAKTVATVDRVTLQQDADNILYHVGANGAVQSRLEIAQKQWQNQTLNLNSQVADDGGTDLAETSIRLTQTQAAYQAALQGSSKILSMSLMDYLR